MSVSREASVVTFGVQIFDRRASREDVLDVLNSEGARFEFFEPGKFLASFDEYGTERAAYLVQDRRYTLVRHVTKTKR